MAWSDEYGCLVSNRALACRGAGVDAAAILAAELQAQQAQTRIRSVAALSDSSLQHYTQEEHHSL